MAAHPRSRGEHVQQMQKHNTVGGSSPLARGTRGNSGDVCTGHRLIPARAGNTQNKAVEKKYLAAHPRSRGEHKLTEFIRYKETGSSPLARGTQGGQAGAGVQGRLIPARAGNTGSSAVTSSTLTAHPRSRGEH